MANLRSTGPGKEYATVDTAPGADGYWTNPVSMRAKGVGNQLFFSIRDGGGSAAWAATLTLQFKCDGDDDWTPYNTYTNTDIPRQLIEGQGKGVLWRLGVKSTHLTAGVVTFGFDW